MSEQDVTALQQAIQKGWPETYFDGPKVKRYVDKFWGRERMGRKITAVVQGNHGDYTVSIEAQEGGLWSACSCYKGKHGTCHHCVALGLTFLDKPDSFVVVEKVEKTAVSDLDSLQAYLNGVTLDELTKQMRAKGITQKAFCEAIGMKPQYLTAVKSSEKRNRHFHELGAIKLAVLWALEHLGS
ncbi:MAG: SWIM zinc finger domain-containing protein [Anaerolineae bacterium]